MQEYLTLSSPNLASPGYLTGFCVILVSLGVLILCLLFPFHPKQIKCCFGLILFWEHYPRVLKRFLVWDDILCSSSSMDWESEELLYLLHNYFEKGKKMSYKKVMCKLFCMEVRKLQRRVLLYFASYCPF